MPEIVSSDVKVEILVHEELKTDNEKEQVEQLVTEEQKETSKKELEKANAVLTEN